MLDYKPQAQKTAVDRALQSFAQTRLGGKLFISVFPAIDRRLLPLTHGRLTTGWPIPVERRPRVSGSRRRSIAGNTEMKSLPPRRVCANDCSALSTAVFWACGL